MQTSTKNQVLDGVIESILDGIHFLLRDSSIKNGLFSVLVEESHSIRCGYYAIMFSNKSFGGSKLITRLETFTIGNHPILRSPRLISHLNIRTFLFYRHLNMYNRLIDICPNHHPFLAIRYLHIALV